MPPHLRDEEKELPHRLEEQKDRWEEKNAGITGEVTAEEIAEIVSSWTGIPVHQLTEEEGARLLQDGGDSARTHCRAG